MPPWMKLGALAAITLGCLVWALWGMDFAAFGQALVGFHTAWVAAVLIGSTVVVVARAIRFAALLDVPVALLDLIAVGQIGFLAINVIPFRMGEFVRPYLLDEGHQVPFGAGMAAVVIERLLDMCALLVLLWLVGATVDIPGGGVVVSGIDLLNAGQQAMLGTVTVGVLGIGALAVAGPRGLVVADALLTRVAPFAAGRVHRLLATMISGFRSLFLRPRAAAVSVGATAVIWAATLGTIAGMMAGFHGLTPSWDLVLVNWTATITATTLIPTPGFVGSWEAGSVGALRIYGVDADVARAFSVLTHFLMTGYTLATGLVFLVWQGRSLGEVVRASRSGH